MSISLDSPEYEAIAKHYRIWLNGLQYMDDHFSTDYNQTEAGKKSFAQFREEGYKDLIRRDLAYEDYRNKFGDPDAKDFLNLDAYNAQLFMTVGGAYLYPKISRYLDSLDLGSVHFSAHKMLFYVESRYNQPDVLLEYTNWSITHDLGIFFDD